MKNTIILAAFIITSICFMMYWNQHNNNTMFKPLTISPSINISNNIQNKSYLDTIVAAGLSRLNIDDIDITISAIPTQAKLRFEQDNSELELAAFINVKYYSDKVPYYVIYISECTRSRAIEILSHELVHLGQYRSNRLHIVNNTNVVWLNQLYDLTQIAYNDRPWEIEAFEQQQDMSFHIKTALY